MAGLSLASKDADQFPDCQVVSGPPRTDVLRRDILDSSCSPTPIASVHPILLDGFAYTAERRGILKPRPADPALNALADVSDSAQEREALRVEIYDYANLEPDAIRGIVTTTQQILARTGMSVQVSLCHGNDAVSCDGPAGERLPLVVRIIPGGAKTMSNVRSERLGQSYVDHDGGIVASVFLAGARNKLRLPTYLGLPSSVMPPLTKSATYYWAITPTPPAGSCERSGIVTITRPCLRISSISRVSNPRYWPGATATQATNTSYSISAGSQTLMAKK